MRAFTYIAVDRQGCRVTNGIDAANVDEARTRLEAEGLDVERIEEVATVVAVPKISVSEATDLGILIGELVEVGLPLASGLRAAGEELAMTHRKNRLARALSDMADQLDSGMALDAVMHATANRFPAHLRGIVTAGLRSGRLDETLAWFAGLAGRTRRRRMQILSAIIYPLATLLIMLGIFLFMAMYVIPQFADLYEDFGADLPAPTKLLLLTAERGPLVILFLTVVIVVVLGSLRIIGGRSTFQRALHSIPLIGKLWYFEALGEFSGLLGLLLRQAVPLPDALRLTGESLRDKAMSQTCGELASMVSDSQPLSEVLSRAYAPLGSLQPVIRWGEQHDTLDITFEYIATTCEGSADLQASFVGPILPPFIFVMILYGVGFTVIALFLPMIRLVSSLT